MCLHVRGQVRAIFVAIGEWESINGYTGYYAVFTDVTLLISLWRLNFLITLLRLLIIITTVASLLQNYNSLGVPKTLQYYASP